MSDIVDWLRSWRDEGLFKEAADEINRLRGTIKDSQFRLAFAKQ